MSDNIIAILGKSKLFTGFSPEQLEQVVSHMQPKAITLKSGELVYERGKAADRCWLIQSGKLTLRRLSLRTPFRQMVYHVGAATGIQGLVDPGSPRAVTMIAESQVELIELTRAGVTLLDKDAQLLLWENVSRLLLRKLASCLTRESLED